MKPQQRSLDKITGIMPDSARVVRLDLAFDGAHYALLPVSPNVFVQPRRLEVVKGCRPIRGADGF